MDNSGSPVIDSFEEFFLEALFSYRRDHPDLTTVNKNENGIDQQSNLLTSSVVDQYDQ